MNRSCKNQSFDLSVLGKLSFQNSALGESAPKICFHRLSSQFKTNNICNPIFNQHSQTERHL